MKRLLVAGFALALLVPACAFAQSAFNGTWKTDVNSIKGSGKPVVVQLKDGMFSVNSTPPIRVKADGKDHPVKGQPGIDSVAIEVLNDHSVREIDKKDGKVVTTTTVTAAPDGKSVTYDFVNQTGNGPVSGTGIADRVGKATPGANAVAGTWQFRKMESISANGLTSTYRVDGDTVHYSDPTGSSYTATIGGKPAAFTSGDGTAGITVAVKRIGNNALRETWFRDGKETGWDKLSVTADGKTMHVTSHDVKTGRSGSSVAHKQ